MSHPTFEELALHLTTLHSPKNEVVGQEMDLVREAFQEMIAKVAPVVPEGPDASLAARSIHRACQDVIAAIALNQED